ncbi:class I SAM-dependent methyltransferase [Aquimarina aquimarini]|uniref:class I SAM-dependent methyltransferase n=1 Tax=Aquimarina aquimarini TaxID=1191734 RepID=UPI000D54C894|nr:class I SAM-dependent methyltransferase [Aquimarina aquimarini]
MYFFSTEVTSSKISSDNPLYQRTRKAYELTLDSIQGNVLEIGCGEGYGATMYHKRAKQLTLIDKSKYSTSLIKKKFPDATVIQKKVPLLSHISDNSFDVILLFQIIEHIKNDKLLIEEIKRVLKPGGTAFLTTPNATKSIARNPWHYKEYTYDQINNLIKNVFNTYTIMGIEGNDKTDHYYATNKKNVERILKLDIFNLQYKTPSFILKIPYEILNRYNRKRLFKKNNELVNTINSQDYSLHKYSKNTLDFFCTMVKKQ